MTFLISLAVGLVAGFAYAWLVMPVGTPDSAPARLNEADRTLYVRLIAASYSANGDSAAASRRLAGLGPTSESELVALIEHDLRSGRADADSVQLVELAVALDIDAPIVGLLAPPRPIADEVNRPSQQIAGLSTPSSPSTNRFQLVGREPVCVSGEDARYIQVSVTDRDGESLAGEAITVRWESGQDRFYTGLKTHLDAGVADFDMQAGVIYSVAIADDQPLVDDLQTHLCADGREGGWRLTYEAQSP
jgi:hypothetical protein